MKNALDQKPDWWPCELLDERQAAALLGLTVPTLQGWRCRKTRDLPYMKLGGGAVRYNPDQIWNWLCRNTIRPMAVTA